MKHQGFMSPADRAQARIDEMNGNPAPTEAATAPANTPPIEASATPAANNPAPEINPTPAPVANVDDPNGETFKARWETLQGMYRTLSDEKSFLLSRVNALEGQVSELLSAAQNPAQAPTPAGNVSELINHLSDYIGADAAEAVRSLVQASASHEVASHIAPVAQQVESVKADTLVSKQQGFELALSERMPEWRSIFNNPSFSAWLGANREGMSGMTYQQCFDKANNDWNLEGLVNIFTKYKEASAPPPAPAPPAADPRLALVSPGRGGSGAPDLTPTERYFKQSEVNAFYKDVALGKYRGREAEQAQMDAAIHQANGAGRIIAG